MVSVTSNGNDRHDLPLMAPRILRWGVREVALCRDYRRRFYPVNPVIDCRPGMRSGHLEILLFQKWLIVLSGVR